MSRLAKLAKKVGGLPAVLLFVFCMGGLYIGRATGLRIMNYVPPNLLPSVEVCEVVQVQAPASDLFKIPK